MDSLSEERIKNILDSADVRYSYNLAKELETIRSNPVLGYRSAGSQAEHDFQHNERGGLCKCPQG